MTQSLVFLSNDKKVPLTSSQIIAEALSYQHKDVLKLIKTYESDITTFGTLERVKLKTHYGTAANNLKHFTLQTLNSDSSKESGRPTQIALLNEQQATLLVCYMRNSEKVRKFKVALVKAFYEMRMAIEKARIAEERPAALLSATEEQALHFEKEKRAAEYAQMHSEGAEYLEWLAGKETEMVAVATDLQAAMTLADSVMKRASAMLNLIAERKAITRSRLVRKMRECEKSERAIEKREHLNGYRCFKLS